MLLIGVSYGRLADFEQEPKSPSSRDAMNVVGMEAGLSSQSKVGTESILAL